MNHPIARILGLVAPPRPTLRYLSLCSGIEAATTAWHRFGWTPLAFSEIEPFPSAVLKHHWPDVPNLGDMTKWREWPDELLAQVDVLVGGTPCQAFSVAGLRNSLSDERGNLTLIYAHLLDHIDTLRIARGLPPVICVWENVPGVLSTKDNAFGCFLGALAGEDEALVPSGAKWTNAGIVRGPQRSICWRVLDAQYFGVAQRRRRVFLVASARNGFRPEAVLFESEGVRRDTPPSREKREVAPTIPARSLGGGGLGTDFDCDGGLVGTYWDGGQVSQTLDAVLAKGQTMPEKNRFPAVPVPDVYPTLDASFNRKWGSNQWVNNGFGIIETAHTLRAEGFGTLRAREQDSHENVGCVHGTQDPCTNEHIGFALGRNHGGENVIGFSCKDHGADASTIAPTLRSMGHHGSHANGGGQVAAAFKPGQSEAAGGVFVTEEYSPTLQAVNNGSTAVPAVAFAQNTRDEVREMKVIGALAAEPGMKQTSYLRLGMQVRRLTVVECCRLQGFPDSYVTIPWKGKPAAECPDGPRYKALGNSMAVPCMYWIGWRIQNHLTAP